MRGRSPRQAPLSTLVCPRFPRRMHAHLVYIVVIVGSASQGRQRSHAGSRCHAVPRRQKR